MGIYEFGASCIGVTAMGEEQFKKYHDDGVGYMEISLSYNMMGIAKTKEYFDALDAEKIKEWSEKYNVRVWSYHLPFDHNEINPAALDEAVRLQTVALDKEMIEKAAKMGASFVVIHASGEPIEDCDYEKSMEQCLKSIKELADFAKTCNITLAVENLPRTCLGKNSDEINKILAVDPTLRVCFDVNHLLSESHKDFVRNVGNKIVTLHVSDYDFVNERHWVPGQGKIDWQELLDLLQEVGYKGSFMNEVNFAHDENSEFISLKDLKAANEKILSM